MALNDSSVLYKEVPSMSGVNLTGQQGVKSLRDMSTTGLGGAFSAQVPSSNSIMAKDVTGVPSSASAVPVAKYNDRPQFSAAPRPSIQAQVSQPSIVGSSLQNKVPAQGGLITPNNLGAAKSDYSTKPEDNKKIILRSRQPSTQNSYKQNITDTEPVVSSSGVSGGQVMSANDRTRSQQHGYVDGTAGVPSSLPGSVESGGHNFASIPAQDGTFGGMIHNRAATLKAGGSLGYQQPLAPQYDKNYDRGNSSIAGDLLHDSAVWLGNKFANGAINVGNAVGGLFGNKQNWRDNSKDVQVPKTDVAKTQELMAKQQVQAPYESMGMPGAMQTASQATVTPKFDTGLVSPQQGSQPQGTQPQGTQPSLTGDERPAFDAYKPPQTHSERLAPLVDATLLAKGNTPEGLQAHRSLMNELAKLDAQSGINQPSARDLGSLVADPQKLDHYFKHGGEDPRGEMPRAGGQNQGTLNGQPMPDQFVSQNGQEQSQQQGRSSGVLYTDKHSAGEHIPGQIGKYDSKGLVDSLMNRAGYSANELAAKKQGPGGLVQSPQDQAEAEMIQSWRKDIAEGGWDAPGARHSLAEYLNNKQQNTYSRATAEADAIETRRAHDEAHNDRKDSESKTTEWRENQKTNGNIQQEQHRNEQNYNRMRSAFPVGEKGDDSKFSNAMAIMDRSAVDPNEFYRNPERVISRIKQHMAIVDAENTKNSGFLGNGTRVQYSGIGHLNHELPSDADYAGLVRYGKDDEVGTY